MTEDPEEVEEAWSGEVEGRPTLRVYFNDDDNVVLKDEALAGALGNCDAGFVVVHRDQILDLISVLFEASNKVRERRKREFDLVVAADSPHRASPPFVANQVILWGHQHLDGPHPKPEVDDVLHLEGAPGVASTACGLSIVGKKPVLATKCEACTGCERCLSAASERRGTSS
jgi:hypothetical protein